MNIKIFWVRAMECMCAQTRPLFTFSSERVLEERSQNPCQLQGKNPLYKKNPPQRRIEPTKLHQAGQRAQHTTNKLNHSPAFIWMEDHQFSQNTGASILPPTSTCACIRHALQARPSGHAVQFNLSLSGNTTIKASTAEVTMTAEDRVAETTAMMIKALFSSQLAAVQSYIWYSSSFPKRHVCVIYNNILIHMEDFILLNLFWNKQDGIHHTSIVPLLI